MGTDEKNRFPPKADQPTAETQMRNESYVRTQLEIFWQESARGYGERMQKLKPQGEFLQMSEL